MLDCFISIVLTRSALGAVPIVKLTGKPTKQSITGDKYILPVGRWNSVISVSRFWFG